MMRSIISLVAILASYTLAIEPVKGQLNGLDRRQTTDYCGVDLDGDNLWCIDSTCCASSQTGVWSCYGPEDQCCATGYTCLGGSQCYLDSLGYQLCVDGSNTVAATTGAAPQTSSSSAASSKATDRPATTTTAATTATTATTASTTSKSSGAGGLGRAADGLAKIVQLAGAAALLL